MSSLFITSVEGGPTSAQTLLLYWQRECAGSSAVQALTLTNKNRLLTVVQHILADTGDINVDQQDIREVLAGATTLQFGLATGSGSNRAAVISAQLWAESTLLGDATLPARRILLAIQSGTATELEMDELTQILEYIMSQAGYQAEVVFGHGLNAALGENIQVTMLVSRH